MDGRFLQKSMWGHRLGGITIDISLQKKLEEDLRRLKRNTPRAIESN